MTAIGSQCKFKKPVLQVWKSFQDWSIYVFSSKTHVPVVQVFAKYTAWGRLSYS